MLAVLAALTLTAAEPESEVARVVLRALPEAPFILARRDEGHLVVVNAAGDTFRIDTDGVVTEVSKAQQRAPVRSRRAPADRPHLDVAATFSLARRLEPTILQHSANELFAFPYGTTGEPYLEFAPDSPAFWSVVRTTTQSTYVLRDDVAPNETPARPTGGGPRAATALADGPSLAPFSVSPSEVRLTGAAPIQMDCAHDVAFRVVEGALRADLAAPPEQGGPPLRLDVAFGVVGLASRAELFAAFRDGVEGRAPAGFVPRTFQVHVEDGRVAALDRQRDTTMGFIALSLRFGGSAPLPSRAKAEAAWARAARGGLLLEEARRLCGRDSLAAALRSRAIAEELLALTPAAAELVKDVP